MTHAADDPELRSSEEALALPEGMMLRLYRDKAKHHPQQYFAVFAQPLVEETRKFRAEIDAQIGITDYDHATAAYQAAQAAEPQGVSGTSVQDRVE